jgi:hypothetical protein
MYQFVAGDLPGGLPNGPDGDTAAGSWGWDALSGAGLAGATSSGLGLFVDFSVAVGSTGFSVFPVSSDSGGLTVTSSRGRGEDETDAVCCRRTSPSPTACANPQIGSPASATCCSSFGSEVMIRRSRNVIVLMGLPPTVPAVLYVCQSLRTST